MSKPEKKNFIKEIESIININTYLNEGFYNDFINSKQLANKNDYIYFLKYMEKDYLYKTWIIIFLEFIILIGYFILRLIIFLNEFVCDNEPFEDITFSDGNTNQKYVKYYWDCSDYIKCKVSKKKINIIDYLRFFYFIFFYFFVLLYKFICLLNFTDYLQKLKNSRLMIIIYKLIKYGWLLLIIVLDYFDNKKCFQSENSYLFVKVKDNRLYIGLSIFDIILELIK